MPIAISFADLLQQANVSQLGYLLCTAWAGASLSLPASSCPAPALPGAAPEGTRPTCCGTGVCAKEASEYAQKGWGPSPSGDLRGQFCLSQPEERCGCPGHQPLLALLARGHKLAFNQRCLCTGNCQRGFCSTNGALQ